MRMFIEEVSPNPIQPIRHRKNRILARAMEVGDEFVVLEGSQANKDIEYAVNSYAAKRALPASRSTYSRRISPSRPPAPPGRWCSTETQTRTKWKLVTTGQTYSEWQDERRRELEGDLVEDEPLPTLAEEAAD